MRLFGRECGFDDTNAVRVEFALKLKKKLARPKCRYSQLPGDRVGQCGPSGQRRPTRGLPVSIGGLLSSAESVYAFVGPCTLHPEHAVLRSLFIRAVTGKS